MQDTGLVMVHIVVRPMSGDKAHRKNKTTRIFKRSSKQLENRGKKANISTKLNVATLKKHKMFNVILKISPKEFSKAGLEKSEKAS